MTVEIHIDEAEAYLDRIEPLVPGWIRFLPTRWMWTFGIKRMSGEWQIYVRPRWRWLQDRLGT